MQSSLRRLRFFSCALAAVFVSSLAVQAQTVVFSENWSGYANGASLIGNGYTWQVPTGPKNTAIVHDYLDGQGSPTGKKFLSVTSWGGADVPNGPMAYKAANLNFSQSLSTTISSDIRYWSPGTSRLGSPYPSVTVLANNSQRLRFGFYNTSRVFVHLSNQDQIIMDLDTPIDANAWYRFTLNFDHATGGVSFAVVQLDGLDGAVVSTIWETGTFDPVTFTSMTGYRFEMSRPGAQAEENKGFHLTSDFSGLTITTTAIPEASSVAGLIAVSGVVAGALVMRRRKVLLGKN